MRFIHLDANNLIDGIRYGAEIVTGEIQSDTGELGQIMQSDGTFVTPETTPTEPIPTLEDKVNYLYYKSKGVIS